MHEGISESIYKTVICFVLSTNQCASCYIYTHTIIKVPLCREKTNLNRSKQHIRECHTYIEKFREKKDQCKSLTVTKNSRKTRKILSFRATAQRLRK